MWDRVDTLIAELAERQHGVVEHGQLVGLGLSDSAIGWRVAVGRLHRLHVGVYAVGHAKVSAAGRRLAAVLACGRGALISHQTAGDLWNVRPTASPRIHVTVPTTAGRRRPGIAVHRSRTLSAEHAATVDGIPVTTVSRTLADLATCLDAASLRKTIERANRLKLLDVASLPKTRRLQEAIEAAHLGHVDSDLESDFLALCRTHGIPKPETHALVAGHRVDFLWRAEKVVVETDGWAYHSGRREFRGDRRRDADLTLRGYAPLRFTYEDVHRDAEDTASRLTMLLAQRKPRLRNQ